MADYRAMSTGVYSDLARWEVWNGSTWVAATVLPTIADDVYANSYTVTIDVDSFASSYKTIGISGVAASGGFVLNGGITATGDVRAGGSICISHSDAADSYIIGDIFGGTLSGQQKHGVLGTGDGTVYVTGNVTGGFQNNSTIAIGSTGIRANGSGSFVVNGNTLGGTGNWGVGAYSTNVLGRVYGRATGVAGTGKLGAANCIVDECASYNQDLIVTSKFIHDSNNNLQGLVNCRAQDGAPVQVEIYDESSNAVTLNPIAAQGHASQSDVRLGTSYANGALTGTCAVPPAGSVGLGVPVDNTTGTGSVTSAEIRDLILPSILSAITAP
jgi:hypothetical protein